MSETFEHSFACLQWNDNRANTFAHLDSKGYVIAPGNNRYAGRVLNTDAKIDLLFNDDDELILVGLVFENEMYKALPFYRSTVKTLSEKYGPAKIIEFLEYPYEGDIDHPETAISLGKGVFVSRWSNLYASIRENFNVVLGYHGPKFAMHAKKNEMDSAADL